MDTRGERDRPVVLKVEPMPPETQIHLEGLCVPPSARLAGPHLSSELDWLRQRQLWLGRGRGLLLLLLLGRGLLLMMLELRGL